MTLSPDAQRWLAEPFPIGNIDDNLGQAIDRMKWSRTGRSGATFVEVVAPSGARYRVTQTPGGPSAQRNP